MKKSWIPVFLLWLLFTVLGLVLVMNTSVMPAQYSEEAHHIDEAYELLEVLAVPVMALVFAIMLWGAIAWRSKGADREDGPPQRGTKMIIGGWLVVTVALAVGIVINPGFVGLAAVRGDNVARRSSSTVRNFSLVSISVCRAGSARRGTDESAAASTVGSPGTFPTDGSSLPWPRQTA